MSAPKRKAPGPDGIPYELYKVNFNLVAEHLLAAMNRAVCLGIPIPGSGQGTTVLIHKKGPTKEFKNWRPITLLNTDQKLLSRILVLRLNNTAPN